jgi:predicted MPP superfamily phosphohydrolase
MKLVRLNDLHLEFLSMNQADSFLCFVAAHRPDAIVIIGDTSSASSMRSHLARLGV